MVVLGYGVFTFFTISNPLSNSLSISNNQRRIGLDYSVFLFNLSEISANDVLYICFLICQLFLRHSQNLNAEIFSLQQQPCSLFQAFFSDISDRFKKQKKSCLESHLSKHIVVDGFMLNQVLKRQKSNSSPFNFTLEITSLFVI